MGTIGTLLENPYSLNFYYIHKLLTYTLIHQIIIGFLWSGRQRTLPSACHDYTKTFNIHVFNSVDFFKKAFYLIVNIVDIVEEDAPPCGPLTKG